ncbi:MAG: carbonic anhydrase [Deltaproteobacteria bacterium]|nr:carbonic anhydrase [Deltaproteobacteria bacterium]
MHQWGRERQRVQATQHPKAMVLSCSDSRVPPEHIFDQGLGDLFVVRTAGNIADAIAVGSLEYAAEHLHSKVLIVLGHERCGAVTAAASGQKMPTKNLDAIVKKIAPAVAASSGWSKGPALVHMAAENNVARTADDLLKQSPVLRKAVAEGHLTILRAMYDLDSGKVTPLP